MLYDVEEIRLVWDYDCGMANANEDKLKSKMLEKGISLEEISKISIGEWIEAIESEESNVFDGVEKIKNSPIIPDSVPVHGLIMDSITGKIDILINGYNK